MGGKETGREKGFLRMRPPVLPNYHMFRCKDCLWAWKVCFNSRVVRYCVVHERPVNAFQGICSYFRKGGVKHVVPWHWLLMICRRPKIPSWLFKPAESNFLRRKVV